MKKIFYVLIGLIVVLTMASCVASPNLGNQNNNNNNQNQNQNNNNNNNQDNVDDTEENAVNVIILCGQSNAEGHTWVNNLRSTNPALYNKYLSGNVNSSVRIKYRTDALSSRRGNETFELVKLDMGFRSTQTDYRFGPEIGMTEVFDSADLSRDLYIIKYTHGGTCLYDRWHSTNSPKGEGPLYTGLVDFVWDAIGMLEEEGLYPFIKAICWMQGESDATTDHAGYAQNYESYEDTFIKDLDEAFSYYKEDENDTIKFISAGISDCEAWYYYTTINNAKRANAAKDPSNRYFIDTIGLGLKYNTEPTVTNPDRFHYDSLSMIELGKAFANAVLSFNIL